MATKTTGKNVQAGKRMAHLFPNHHETLKRSEREDEKALEKHTLLNLKNSQLLSCAQATLMRLHCFDGVFYSVKLTETLYGLSSSNNSTRIEIHRGSSTTSIMVIQTLIRPSFSNKLISWRGKITCLSYFIFCP